MKKRTAVITISILCAAIVALGAFSVYQASEIDKAKQVQDIYGEQSLLEMTASLAAMNAALRESAYVTDAALCSRLYMDVAAGSATALVAMGSLPYATHELEKTAKFINGAGDYALALSRAASRGRLPGEEEAKNVAGLAETLSQLASELSEISRGVADGAVKLDEYGEGADAGKTDTVGYELRVLEETVPEYPKLKYDGKFADSGRPESGEKISEAEARRAAALFLNVPEQRLNYEGESGSELPCLYFSMTKEDGEEQRIAVTAESGEVAQWSYPCKTGAELLKQEDAAKIAAEFLRAHGYENVGETSIRCGDGVCVVSYAAVDRGVLCMPDVLSVSVALDSGEPCAFMADEYILNHRDRGDLVAKVSPTKAAETLPKSLTPKASRLIVAETAGGAELLCHEMACETEDGSAVTVFVNAETGAQEKIVIGRSGKA
ncbi:MAG: germination protein YpeB [Oscillospiraceae bacterium]